MIRNFVLRYLATGGLMGWVFWLGYGAYSLIIPTGPSAERFAPLLVLGFSAVALIPAGLWTWFSHERAATKELAQLRAEVVQLRQAANPYTGGPESAGHREAPP